MKDVRRKTSVRLVSLVDASVLAKTRLCGHKYEEKEEEDVVMLKHLARLDQLEAEKKKNKKMK